jgi:hypothetical protein
MASRALPPGLYDELITVALNELIDGLGDEVRPSAPSFHPPKRRGGSPTTSARS